MHRRMPTSLPLSLTHPPVVGGVRLDDPEHREQPIELALLPLQARLDLFLLDRQVADVLLARVH